MVMPIGGSTIGAASERISSSRLFSSRPAFAGPGSELGGAYRHRGRPGDRCPVPVRPSCGGAGRLPGADRRAVPLPFPRWRQGGHFDREIPGDHRPHRGLHRHDCAGLRRRSRLPARALQLFPRGRAALRRQSFHQGLRDTPGRRALRGKRRVPEPRRGGDAPDAGRGRAGEDFRLLGWVNVQHTRRRRQPAARLGIHGRSVQGRRRKPGIVRRLFPYAERYPKGVHADLCERRHETGL